eukprot:8173615-Lingulodinium_polyedra.AAC.1
MQSAVRGAAARSCARAAAITARDVDFKVVSEGCAAAAVQVVWRVVWGPGQMAAVVSAFVGSGGLSRSRVRRRGAAWVEPRSPKRMRR